MTSIEEQVLRTAKEIVVKFIETGRISPNSFHESFPAIYDTVRAAVTRDADTPRSASQTQDD